MCVCTYACAREGRQREPAVQRGEDAPGKGRPVTQLSKNLGRMVTSPPGWVWDEGGGFQAAAVTSLEGHAIARV